MKLTRMGASFLRVIHDVLDSRNNDEEQIAKEEAAHPIAAEGSLVDVACHFDRGSLFRRTSSSVAVVHLPRELGRWHEHLWLSHGHSHGPYPRWVVCHYWCDRGIPASNPEESHRTQIVGKEVTGRSVLETPMVMKPVQQPYAAYCR